MTATCQLKQEPHSTGFNISGVPTQLFGPPTWRVLFNLFYVAEGGAVCTDPPFHFPPEFRLKAQTHIKRIWQNLPFVLPCAVCRVESGKFILNGADISSAKVQSSAATINQPSRPASFKMLQDFRDDVNVRLLSKRCVSTMDKLGMHNMREVAIFKLRSGVYGMSKMDVVEMCYFIEYNRSRRVQNKELSQVCPNHCVFLKSLCSLLSAGGWIKKMPENNMCNFIDAISEIHPPNFGVWRRNMDTVIKDWFTT